MSASTQKLRIIVGGLVGQYPLGGVAWDYFHYVLGLHELGHDVYYDENTNTWPYDAVKQQPSDDGSVNAKFLGDFFRIHAPDLSDKWHYCVLLKDHFGMSKQKFDEIAATADIYLNVSGGCILPESLNPKCIKVFMDTDPGFTQIGLHGALEKDGRDKGRFAEVAAFDRHLTYAENIWADDCRLPRFDFKWITTRPIVTLPHWDFARRQSPKETVMTTVMTLNFTKEMRKYTYQGVDYFDKRAEFEKFIDLPGRSPLPLRLAMGSNSGIEPITSRKWQVVPAYDVSQTPEAYQHFIADSLGEWSIAKNFYVATRSGWFSCRTCCYLAAGRPAVVQDTAWSRYVPAGRGLFAFNTADQAIAGLEAIARDPEGQRQAAFEVAREYLAPDRVLPGMLDHIMAGQ